MHRHASLSSQAGSVLAGLSLLAACEPAAAPSDEAPAFGLGSVAVPPPYQLIDISIPGERNSFAVDINDQGWVLGWSSNFGPWLRQPNGNRTFLGTFTRGLPGISNALNRLNQATGFSYTGEGPAHAFFWSATGGMIDLGTLAGNQGESEGIGINNLGDVVGSSSFGRGPNFSIHAFLWSPRDGVMHDLGTMGGDFSIARDINDRGEVVGEAQTRGFNRFNHAFIWTRTGGMVDLGTLGGTFSVAHAINNRSEVVGQSETTSGESHGFLWTVQTGMVDLGPLGASISITAWDINDRGQIVGTGLFPIRGFRGFLKPPAEPFIDLGDLGGQSRAFGINSCGRIAGSTNVPGDPFDHAALWLKRC